MWINTKAINAQLWAAKFSHLPKDPAASVGTYVLLNYQGCEDRICTVRTPSVVDPKLFITDPYPDPNFQ
jgi:hypothetical protein